MAFYVAALVAAGTATALARDPWTASAAWCLLIAGFAWIFREPGSRGSWTRRDALAIVAVTLVAAFLRVYRIHEIPYGLWIDEIRAARNALALVASGSFAPFGTTPLAEARPNWVHTSNLYLYFAWVAQSLGGFGLCGVKMISVIPGVLAAPALFVFTRSFLPRPFAFLAAGLLAGSIWHTTVSRWGWDQVLVTTLSILVFHFLYRGTVEGRASMTLYAGLVGGLSLYSYISSRVLVLAALAVLGSEVALRRTRRSLKHFLIFPLGVVAAALPLILCWIENPGIFWVRITELSAPSAAEGGGVALLARQAVEHLLMFHVAGDRNLRSNLSGEPMLDPLAGALFGLGCAVALWRWKKLESRTCLIWMLVGLLGGILSVSPLGGPQSYRTGLVAPACFVLAAIGAAALFGVLRTRVGLGSRFVAAAVAALVAASSLWAYAEYFCERPRSPQAWFANPDGARSRCLLKVTKRAIANDVTVLLDNGLQRPALKFELAEASLSEAVGWIDSRKPWQPQVAGLSDFVVLTPRQGPPELHARPVLNPFGVRIAFGSSVNAALLSDLSCD